MDEDGFYEGLLERGDGRHTGWSTPQTGQVPTYSWLPSLCSDFMLPRVTSFPLLLTEGCYLV